MRGKQVDGGGESDAARISSRRSDVAAPRDKMQFVNKRLARRLIVVGVLLAGLVAWVASHRDGQSSPTAPVPDAAPRVVSLAELRTVAKVLEQDVYWAGPMSGTELVLKELSDGGVQVAYLPSGTAASRMGSSDLTIGSYPLADPTSAIERIAREAGSVTTRGVGGRQVVVRSQTPNSAYFASPSNTIQVEVYDPSRKTALKLARSGRVRDVN